VLALATPRVPDYRSRVTASIRPLDGQGSCGEVDVDSLVPLPGSAFAQQSDPALTGRQQDQRERRPVVTAALPVRERVRWCGHQLSARADRTEKLHGESGGAGCGHCGEGETSLGQMPRSARIVVVSASVDPVEPKAGCGLVGVA